jgi:DNA-binding transcriptional regulator YiaG
VKGCRKAMKTMPRALHPKSEHSMTGPELRKLREKLDLTPTAAAASIGVSARTWQRWEASKKAIPEPAARLFKIMQKL